MHGRRAWWIVALALLAALLASSPRPARAADIPIPAAAGHVRPSSRAARTLIDTAAERSATVRRLIQLLGETDVIVYVQLTIAPHVETGRTAFTASTPRGRFLRIMINARMPPWEQVQLLGHELQHALEIAGAPGVRDDKGMRELYGRIGRPGQKPNQFETVEAQRIQALVRREYASSPLTSLPRPR